MTINDFIGKVSPTISDIAAMDALNGVCICDSHIRRNRPEFKEYARVWKDVWVNVCNRKLIYGQEQLLKTWG